MTKFTDKLDEIQNTARKYGLCARREECSECDKRVAKASQQILEAIDEAITNATGYFDEDVKRSWVDETEIKQALGITKGEADE